MYKNRSLKKYLDDLSKRIPAPGGGSASCLSSALGTSLLVMVINFTLGKPKYKKYEKELKRILKKLEKLKEEFLRLLDLDVIAYKSKNIKSSLEVPLRLCRLSFLTIKLCPYLIDKTNINLSSDIAVAGVLLESGFCGGYFNVRINLRLLKDKKLNQRINKELIEKQKLVKKIRKYTEVKIDKIIGR